MARELEPNIHLFLGYLPSIPHGPVWVLVQFGCALRQLQIT
jgi:hypothetical protein